MKRVQKINKSKGCSKTKMKVYTSSDARRVASKNGWILDRSKGSHFIYKHPDSDKILTIPKRLNRMVWERVVNEYHLNLDA